MKWLSEIKVNDAGNALANFWMKPAYRIPTSPDGNEDPPISQRTPSRS